MTDRAVLRTGRDRLRYAVSFELTLLALLVPAGAAFFDRPLVDVGLLGGILCVKALVVNLVYNWIFDRIEARSGRVSSERSTPGRILHATGFEITLTLLSLPFYMFFLQVTALEALAADIVVATLVVGYTYAFTLAYDRLFPLVRPGTAQA